MAPIYFYMHKPTIVFKGRVAAPPNPQSAGDGQLTVDITNTTFGSVSAIRDGMTLALGSADGLSDRGRQRVRIASSTAVPGAATLTTGMFGLGRNDGELELIAGSYATVYDEYRVWAKVALYTAADPGEDPLLYSILKDGYNSDPGQMVNPRPWANGGSAFADTINPSTGRITVTFDGSGSRSFDVNAAYGSNYNLISVSSYSWDIADGTLTAGTLSSSSITATFPAGFRYVHLTVVGPAGRGHTTHIPVFARDPNNDQCIAHQITGHSAEYGGQELSVRLLQDVYKEYSPDGVLCLLWEGNAPSPSSRNHMIFVGWEESNDNSAKGTKTELVRESTIKLVDVCGRLKKLGNGTMFLADHPEPASWVQTKIPTMIFFAWYIVYWHSTAIEVAPFDAPEPIFNLLHYKMLAIDEASIYDQVNHLSNMTTPDHYFCCTRDGRMNFRIDGNLEYLGNRDASVYTFGTAQWTEISWNYERAPKAYKLLTYAVLGNKTDTALACLSPGRGLGQGVATIQSNGERLCQDQTNLNFTEGNRYARLNAPWGKITVRLPYQTVTTTIDPGKIPFVTVSMGTNISPPRGFNRNNPLRALAWRMEIDYTYERTGLIRMATFVLEAETSGPAAITIPAPT